MSGHTPGPWAWDRVPLPGLGPARWCDVLNGASSAVLRHEASGGPTPWGISEPDKALIAAAPELLEAVLWLRNLASGVGRAGDAPEPGEFEAAVDAADVAIEKAKGLP